MGLFKKFRKRFKRARKKIQRKVQKVLDVVAPLAASFIPGPVGLLAQAAFAPTPPDDPPIGLAGFAAQQTRATVGPRARAACPAPQQRLPARFAFPGFSSSVGGGFSAPFRAARFPPSAGSTARSPLKFGNSFPRRAFVGSVLPQRGGAFPGFGFGTTPLSVLAAFGRSS